MSRNSWSKQTRYLKNESMVNKLLNITEKKEKIIGKAKHSKKSNFSREIKIGN